MSWATCSALEVQLSPLHHQHHSASAAQTGLCCCSQASNSVSVGCLSPKLPA